MTAEPLHLLGVDIGGTKTAVAVVEAVTGEVIARRVEPTPAEAGPRAVMNAAADLAARVLAIYPAVAGGVGAPGVVDAERGVVLLSTGYLRDWSGTPVGPELERQLGLPFAADNDVNAAALGEARYGAGHGLRSFLFAALGTGLGGAIVRDGRVLRGASGTAGELGHIPVFGVGAEVMCSCGRPGHLEAVVAAPAITAAYERATGEAGVDLRVIARRAAMDEPPAVATLASAGTVFGRALGGLVNVLDPEAVILGGGVMMAGRPVWEPLEEALRAETLPSASDVALRPAALGVDAAVIGAAALALDLVGADNGATGPGAADGARVPATSEA